jgi:CubicO group peptidase (beta-lactamase class C family)
MALALLAGCDSPTGPGGELRKPPETGDGWETATLASVGMDGQPLRELLRLIESTDNHMIHSLLIARDGKLVLERYWNGVELRPEDLTTGTKTFNRNQLHYVASVSKSITSALAGIALDRGLIESVDELLFHHFSEHQDLVNDEKGSITLRHLLSFSSGFEWNEHVFGFDDPRDSHYQMFSAEDPIRYLLGRPVTTAPGEAFHYNSGDTNLVGEIIRNASSAQSLMGFAEDLLFGPLDINSYEWMTIGTDSGFAFASGGISLRPRDMAKLGQLYLDGGVWAGRRVVSQGWVEESVEMAVPLIGDYTTLYGYGYNWWLGRFQFEGAPVDYFRAAGWGGQDIFVIPDLELVVVFTAGGYHEARPLSVNQMIQYHIFAAITG